jgi:hypothetical protein
MFRISSTKIIELTRGDSFMYPLFINIGTEMYPERYLLKEGDTVYFAVMEPNQKFEDAILKKVYTASDEETPDGDLIISIRSEDTEHLEPGKYYYTIKAKFSDSKLPVQTIIENREFWILD